MASKGKTRIRKLRVNEVSLVNRPANPHARVLLAKRDDELDDTLDLFEDDVEKGEDCDCGEGDCDHCGIKGDKVAKADFLSSALGLSVQSIMDDDSLTVEKRQELVDSTVSSYRDSILALDTHVSPDAATAIDKNDIPETHMNEEILKGLSPEQSAMVTEMIEKSVAAAAAGISEKLEKAQKDATEARVELAKRDRLEKAAKLVGSTAVAPETVATLLEKLDESGEAIVADLLTKLDVAVKAGSVLKEIGSDRGEAPVGPEAELNKAVEELRKSDATLSPAEAYAKALAANPSLYAQMVR